MLNCMTARVSRGLSALREHGGDEVIVLQAWRAMILIHKSLPIKVTHFIKDKKGSISNNRRVTPRHIILLFLQTYSLSSAP